MEKSESNQRFWPLLIVLTLCFIWGNSLLPASISGAISQWVKELVNQLLWFWKDGSLMSGDGLLRKLAHASEFALLGAELTCWRVKGITRIQEVLLFGLLAALTDETIQLFVAGRSGQIRDVWIDLLGVLIGCLFVLVFRHLRRKKAVKSTSYPQKETKRRTS